MKGGDLMLTRINSKVFNLTENGKPIIISLYAYTPFGIEEYNNKNVVNWEFSANTNYGYNKLIELRRIEKFIKQAELEELEGKNIKSTLKNRYGNRHHIRSFLTNDTDGVVVPKKKVKIELYLSKVWVYCNNYGITWNVIKIVPI